MWSRLEGPGQRRFVPPQRAGNGQWSRYMELELEKYRSGEFKLPHRKMKKAVHESKPSDAAAAAHWFGAQGK